MTTTILSDASVLIALIDPTHDPHEAADEWLALHGHKARMETQAVMKRRKGVVSHHEREVAELRADCELAVDYPKAALASLDDPDGRARGLAFVVAERGLNHPMRNLHLPQPLPQQWFGPISPVEGNRSG